MRLKRLQRGFQHTTVLLQAGGSPAKRQLIQRMIHFSRTLPERFDQPLPTMMAQLTPKPQPQLTVTSNEIRRLADAVAAWHWWSPLGICLRRSLLRYYFLREAQLSVQVTFGARFKEASEGGGLGGHAWLLFNGEPYYEAPEDYQGFTRMLTYPEEAIDTD